MYIYIYIVVFIRARKAPILYPGTSRSTKLVGSSTFLFGAELCTLEPQLHGYIYRALEM